MRRRPVPVLDFVRGDATGLMIPAHAGALRHAGPTFLTEAFRAFGALAADNAVRGIAGWEPCGGGSTGDKLFLTLDYARDQPGLPRKLFVKFSRDFTDARRDSQRFEMQSEARFAAVQRQPGFPTAAPIACFGDFEAASGTGLVISERIFFGEGGIEPHRRKCLDHETLDDPLPYYRAIVTALARLAAAHRSGRLDGIDATFPFDPVAGSADPIRYPAAALPGLLRQGEDFAAAAPRLLPEDVRTPAFAARLAADAALVVDNEAALRCALIADPRMIALCHWNAHIDNAWFERDAEGALRCGLIDWGRVGQMTLGSALWGGLSAAHPSIWDDHLDALLALFATEYRAGGGPAITVAALRAHLFLHIAVMGVARVLAFPEVILFRLPEAVDATGPTDAMFRAVDPARNSLHVYTVFLKLWQRHDFGAVIRRALAQPAAP